MNTVYLMLPLYLNKHLMIIINSHESLLGNGQHDWNVAGCTFHTMIDTVTISGGSRCQLLVSSPSSFSPDSKNIDWLPFLNQHLHFWLTNIKFFQFLSQFLWKKTHRWLTIFYPKREKVLTCLSSDTSFTSSVTAFLFIISFENFIFIKVFSYLRPDLVEFLNSCSSASFFSSSIVLAEIVWFCWNHFSSLIYHRLK